VLLVVIGMISLFDDRQINRNRLFTETVSTI
jgi:hypothetical protein